VVLRGISILGSQEYSDRTWLRFVASRLPIGRRSGMTLSVVTYVSLFDEGTSASSWLSCQRVEVSLPPCDILNLGQNFRPQERFECNEKGVVQA
jgi:hypothetical protein